MPILVFFLVMSSVYVGSNGKLSDGTKLGFFVFLAIVVILFIVGSILF